jgi:hypothetical protein
MVMEEATLASNSIEFVIHLSLRNDPSSLDSPNNALSQGTTTTTVQLSTRTNDRRA